METQQQGDAYGHIAISREVAINLQRIAINGHEVLNTRIEERIVEHPIDKVDANIIGNDGFLEQTCHDEEEGAT